MDNLRAFAESCQEIESEEPPDRDHLADEQKVDDSLQSAWKEAEDRENDEFDVRGGLLYKIESGQGPVTRTRLAVPQQRRQVLLKLAHSSPWAAHLGRRKTLERLQQHFYWPGMTQDVKRLTQECVDCQEGNKDKTGKAPLVICPLSLHPFKDSYGYCKSITSNCKEKQIYLDIIWQQDFLKLYHSEEFMLNL